MKKKINLGRRKVSDNDLEETEMEQQEEKKDLGMEKELNYLKLQNQRMIQKEAMSITSEYRIHLLSILQDINQNLKGIGQSLNNIGDILEEGEEQEEEK